MSDEIGEIFEQYGKKRFEWRVSDFMSLVRKSELEGAKEFYESPKFLFADSCWCFKIYPNESKGWLRLYLCRMNSGLPEAFRLSLGIMTVDGKERILYEADRTFYGCSRWGSPKLLPISEFLDISPDIPLGVFTFICILKSQSQQPAEGSLFKRLWNLSLSLKNILDERKWTDVVLKLKDGEIPAHRLILESRSSVFNSTFGVNMRGAETGVVPLEDEDGDTFKVLLSYIYSGEPEGICAENACEVYEIAHKYGLGELKKLCVACMEECLNVDTLWNIISIADWYEETKLKECAKTFFAKNATEVFETVEWSEIKKNKPELGFEVVEYVFGNKLPRQN